MFLAEGRFETRDPAVEIRAPAREVACYCRRMCTRVTCRTCGKATYAGCGRHVDAVLRGVPEDQRCRCEAPRPSGLLATVLGWLHGAEGRKPS